MKIHVIFFSFLLSLSNQIFAQSSTVSPNQIDVSSVLNDTYGYSIRGVLDNAAPGNNSAAIIGRNKRTSSGGLGVWGIHDGYGWGVLGQSKAGIGVFGYSEDGIALLGSSNSKVARFESFSQTNPYTIFEIYNSGTGGGIDLILGNTNSSSKGIAINHLGDMNSTGLYVSTNGTSVWANSKGGIGIFSQVGTDNSLGIAGKFENINSANSNNALEAFTIGTGAAASFKNLNSDGLGSGLVVGKSMAYKTAFTTNAHVDFEVRHPIEEVNGMTGLRILNNGPNLSNWTLYTANSTGDLILYADGIIKGTFNGSTGAYTAISDKRLKTNIKDYTTTLANVMKLEVKSYQRLNSTKTEIGLMAQDALKYFPEIVYDNTNDKGEQFYTMDYCRLGVIAIKAVQEQQKEIELLKNEIAELKKLMKK
ncbi:tail fiber domain-containing protein [Emticicia sp. C21]|uniref:tail fiber domain-containing protein n=1 Tax=Emticicia sp. C21 TaxID=2302915 RepID=UPI000E354B8A|nr:tail fiber domain-containing protein [Emticicia sp. C21]RFS17721.1 tail fiber domain-containing protein [Emticicia sp. C21]